MEARAAGLQGSVILSIEIAPDGHTQNPHVIHALGMELDEKAIDAVKRWGYDSAPNSNAPLLHRVVEIPFRLKPAGPWVLDASVFRARPSGPGATTKPELRQYVAPDPAVCSAQGYVEANFNIGSDGEPSDIQVAANVPGSLRDSVLKAIQSWRFRPATRNGSDDPGTARVLLEYRPAQTLAAPTQIYSGGVSTTRSSSSGWSPNIAKRLASQDYRAGLPSVLSSSRMVKCRAYESCGLSEWDSTSKRFAL